MTRYIVFSTALMISACSPATKEASGTTPSTISITTSTTSTVLTIPSTLLDHPPTTRASRSQSRSSGRQVISTAYCDTGRMADGHFTHIGAMASNSFPLGTVLHVSRSPYGERDFVVEDRIGWGSQLDFSMPGDCGGARNWGRKEVEEVVVSAPSPN